MLLFVGGDVDRSITGDKGARRAGSEIVVTQRFRRLARNLPGTSIDTTEAVGLDPDWVEAVAFAWLAMRTMNKQTGNLPSVTGARQEVILGTTHFP